MWSEFTSTLAVLLTAAAVIPVNAMTWEEVGCSLTGGGVMDCTDLRTGGSLEQIPSGLPTDLVHLWLSDNRITSINNDDLAGLSQLRYLYLDGNMISNIAPGAFNALAQLRVLIMDGNSVSDFPEGLFASCQQLTHVDFRNNELTAVRAASFFGLLNVQHVNLYGNNIADVECGAFNHIESASYFNTAGNPTHCAASDDGALECTCHDGSTTGSNGFCAESTDCYFLQPVFPHLVTTTTTQQPNNAENRDDGNSVQDWFVGNGSFVVTRQSNLEGAQKESDDSGGSNAGLASAIALCVVAVIALIGTVVIRSRHRQSAFATASTKASSDVASSYDSASVNSSEQERVRRGSLSTTRSDHIDLHWDDGVTETDRDWIEAPSVKNQDDDAKSHSTQSTVKSSILSKFMNAATKVWTKDRYEDGEQIVDLSGSSAFTCRSSAGTSVTDNSEESEESTIINVESEAPQQKTRDVVIGVV